LWGTAIVGTSASIPERIITDIRWPRKPACRKPNHERDATE
jgi:hypothetical protein